MNFARYLRHFQATASVPTEKYFTNKIVKSPLQKKLETAGKKNNDIRREKTSSLHIFLLFKKFFIPLFSASHDTLKPRVFRNNGISLRIYLP